MHPYVVMVEGGLTNMERGHPDHILWTGGAP